MRIDAHQHFWKYNPDTYSWIGKEEHILQKDFLPQDSFIQIKENDIEGIIAVQALHDAQETDFLLTLAQEHTFIKGVVGWTDLASKECAVHIEKLATDKKLKGIRHVLQSEDDGFITSTGFMHGISLLSRYNLCYDILVYAGQLPYILQLVKAFPNQKFVIDHMAKPDYEEDTFEKWKRAMHALSKCENVYCKISGMITEVKSKSWGYDVFVPYLDHIVNAFGVKRLMIGSDWPVCLLKGSYNDVMEIPKTYFEKLSENESDWIWGRTAKEFYNL